MVAGAMRRGDGMRVRVRASAVDGTRRGQLRAGPDSGVPRAQERPGGGGRGRAHAAGRRGTAGRAAVGRGRGWAVERETRERKREGGPGQPGWSGGEAVRPGDAREQRGRRDRARGVGGRREKEREGEGKEKKKKMGKRKKKKEKGGERNKERKRERGASASAPIAAAVGHAWRPGARERDARVEGKQGAGYGCRVFGESKDLAEQGSSRKNWG